MTSTRLEPQKQRIPLAAAGRLQKVIGLTPELTGQRRAGQAFPANEARLKALVGSIDEVVFEFDAKGTHLNIWTRNEDLLAYPKEDRLGRTLGEVSGNDFARPFLEIFARVLRTGEGENIEYPLTVRGRKRWYLGRVNSVPAADGTPATVCLLARDITDRKGADLETRRLALLAENSQSLVAISDLNLGLLFINPAGRRLVGLTNNERPQNTIMTDYFVAGDRQKLETDILPRVMRGEAWKGELRLDHGQRTWAILTYKGPIDRAFPRPRRSRSHRKQYKEREEFEVRAQNPKMLERIITALGYRPSFCYEKYRTAYRILDLPGLVLDLDETPVGIFLEIEGSRGMIDRAAKLLGYSSKDYSAASYWEVYRDHCRRAGTPVRNMVFPD